VAAQHDDLEAAERDSEVAYVELLSTVLEAASPALLAISSAIPGADGRGLCLVHGEGEDLWWLENGTIVTITRTGTSRQEPVTVESLVKIYGRHGAVDAVMQISIAIDAQLRGGKQQATEKMRRRAEQIRALATLAKGLV
jgi:hypothetical protein